MVNLAEEKKRLEKEAEANRADIVRLEHRLADQSFLAKAPANVVDKERQRLTESKDKLSRLEQQLAKM